MSELSVRDRAPDAVVLDTAGGEVHLASLWQDHFAALVFLRHYG
ncbi:MAG TPA: hypothetical protein VF406_13775 [Thermodesulfobacteriota bacterium]